MFKKQVKRKLDNLYDLIISLNNNERNHSVKLQTLMDNYKEDLIKVMADLERKNELLEFERKVNEELRNANNELNAEVVRLTEIVKDNKNFQDGIEEYLKKVATMATNIQKEHIKKKPTRAELMAEKYYKIPEDVMAKLKWHIP